MPTFLSKTHFARKGAQSYEVFRFVKPRFSALLFVRERKGTKILILLSAALLADSQRPCLFLGKDKNTEFSALSSPPLMLPFKDQYCLWRAQRYGFFPHRQDPFRRTGMLMLKDPVCLRRKQRYEAGYAFSGASYFTGCGISMGRWLGSEITKPLLGGRGLQGSEGSF
jgi:hypothetical protein